MLRISWVLGVSGILAAIISGVTAVSAKPAQVPENKLVATIAADNKDYESAMARGDARAAADIYEVSALFIAPGPRVLNGRAQIQAFIARVLTRVRYLSGTCRTDHLSQDGDQAYEAGHCDGVVEINGRKVPRGGDYLTVWRRQRNGAWLIEINAAP